MASSNRDEHIEKLTGSENYHTWSFAMMNLLEMNEWEGTIIQAVANRESDATKLRKAKAKLVLSVDSSIYMHIQNCNTAADIWKTLKDLFEDRGLARKIGLLRKLITTRLESSDSMSEYVNQIIMTANKLTGIGFPINDEWLGAILLAGLGDDFSPMIMGLESSGIRISGDAIKSKLLDTTYEKPSGSAFVGKGGHKKKFGRSKSGSGFEFKCFKCKKRGHKANECPDRSNTEPRKGESKETKNAFHAVLLSKDRQLSSHEWYIDSGASQHMTPNAGLLSETKTTSAKEIVAANNAKMSAFQSGKVTLRVNESNIEVNDVLHVPELSANLLSISKIVKSGNRVTFDKDGCSIYNGSNVRLALLKETDGVYRLRSEKIECLLSPGSSTTVSAIDWHRRLGHINYSDLCKMRDGIVDGVKFADGETSLRNCEACQKGKQSRQPFKSSGTKSSDILELVHSDLCGPMENASIGGAKYFLTFIDDFTRKYFVYFLRLKSDVLATFKDFKQLVENQTGKKIKILRTDNGTEYCGNDFQTFCRKSGIRHQTSTTYTPQQNGVAERANRTIVERAKCMIFDADLDKSFWAEAVHTAVYVINRSVNSVLVDKTPEEAWTGLKVNLSAMRIFGSPVMVHVPKQKRAKWDPKSRKMIFVGYDDNTKGYRCIDSTTKRIEISRDVVFLESKSNSGISTEDDADDTNSVRDDPIEHKTPEDDEVVSSDSDGEYQSMLESSLDDTMVNESDHSADDPEYLPAVRISPQEIVRRSSRSKKPNPKYFGNSALSSEGDCDPVCVREAESRHDCNEWKAAMKDELDSLAENATWDLVDIPSTRKAIKSRWVFKTKHDDAGKIIRYKARLVAKGCSQKCGIDYNETYSPVVRYVSIRYLIALSVKLNLKIDQMDAVTAFLQGDLTEEIYMEQPEGFGDGSGKVCRLKKAIYGLKQSGREWNKKLESTLKSFGLRKSRVDPCVYFTENIDLILAISMWMTF